MWCCCGFQGVWGATTRHSVIGALNNATFGARRFASVVKLRGVDRECCEVAGPSRSQPRGTKQHEAIGSLKNRRCLSPSATTNPAPPGTDKSCANSSLSSASVPSSARPSALPARPPIRSRNRRTPRSPRCATHPEREGPGVGLPCTPRRDGGEVVDAALLRPPAEPTIGVDLKPFGNARRVPAQRVDRL